jgi:NAD-dependent SIR2 family protein deacetylase
MTGWEITMDLARRLATLEVGNSGEINNVEEWYFNQYNKAPDYSVLLNELAKTPAERRRLLHSYFEATEDEREQGLKMPTPAHRAIARLVARGYIRVVVTTNFDRLIETALRDEGVEPTVISTADATEGAAPLVHQQCVVVKIHGDYLDDRIKNTEQELATYDPRMDAYLDRVFDEFGLEPIPVGRILRPDG